MSRKLAFIGLALVSAYSTSTMAYDFGPSSMFSLNGFGTLGVVHSDLDRADFSSSTFQPNGAGYSHDWSPDVDSLFGLQGAASYGKWKAVVQAVAKQSPDDDYNPVIEWANVRYSFTDTFSVRVGRMAMPTYLNSDTRLVHYALTAVRPSVEVYRVLPVTTADGVDVSYGFKTGGITHTVRAVWGENNTHFANGMRGNNKGIWAAVNDMQFGDFTVHTAFQVRQLRLESRGISQAVQPFKIADIGINYDNGTWFTMVEVARTWLKKNNLSPDSLAYVVNGGMRFGQFTPYLQYGKLDPIEDTLSSGARSPASSTKTAGLRWDFYNNFALKAQYDYTQAENRSTGNFVNRQPGFPVNSSANVVSISMDFVF